MPPAPGPRKWIPHTLPLLTHGDVRVVCYNILAEVYANPQLYAYTPLWALSSQYRQMRILEELVASQADVICLQEVDADMFHSVLVPELSRRGFFGEFFQKGRARNSGISDQQRRTVDGCATFYSNSKFRCVHQQVLEYQHMGLNLSGKSVSRVLSKDNVALIIVLDCVMDESESLSGEKRRLIIGNTHLHWNPAYSDIKLIQTHFLLEELEGISKKFAEPGSVGVPIVLCGDFNSLPNSAAYNLIRGIPVSPSHPDWLGNNYGNLTERPLEHSSLGLKSAYEITIGEPPFTNKTREFVGVLDYIFVSTHSLAVSAICEPPTENALRHLHALPAPHFPSDHILIGCSVSWLSSN
eukprot:TRINITY_DN10919_c0_g1_i1.p1 TRINITY_DN10919_c0_g1~~TRINITY_DN10919_c0_g1_i1.p1  ORF type:complete len:354 (+),score=58.23 TRINITY_DN10919_c0_g1_i1:549-1610(+)